MALRRAPAAGLKKVEGESGDLFLPLEGHRRAIYAEKCPFLLSQAIHQETRCFPSLAARACGVPPPPDSSHCCTSTQLPNDAQPNDGCPGALPQPTPSSDRLSQSYKPYWNERPPRRNQAARLKASCRPPQRRMNEPRWTGNRPTRSNGHRRRITNGTCQLQTHREETDKRQRPAQSVRRLRHPPAEQNYALWDRLGDLVKRDRRTWSTSCLRRLWSKTLSAYGFGVGDYTRPVTNPLSVH